MWQRKINYICENCFSSTVSDMFIFIYLKYLLMFFDIWKLKENVNINHNRKKVLGILSSIVKRLFNFRDFRCFHNIHISHFSYIHARKLSILLFGLVCFFSYFAVKQQNKRFSIVIVPLWFSPSSGLPLYPSPYLETNSLIKKPNVTLF